MPSTFTVNKGVELPASGDYVNSWAAPINADFTDIDTALGGATSISVTGIGAGTVTLSLSQYRPPNIEFTGTLSANLNYQIPTGIGGVWTISNATTGAFTLTFSIAAGNSITLSAGRSLIVSDGINVALADSTAIASGRLVGAYTGITAIGQATAQDSGSNPHSIGWLGLPQNTQPGNYTLGLIDRCGSILYAGPGGNTYTVPAGIFVAEDVVTIIAFNNTNTLTIAPGVGLTLYWAGNGATSGSRTLTSVGIATVYFASSTNAIITGAGLS